MNNQNNNQNNNQAMQPTYNQSMPAAPYQNNQGQAPVQQPGNSRAPIDKGRIMGVVDEFQAKENGTLLVNPDGSPKMKAKWWPIGECTKWLGNNGEYTVRKILVQPLKPGIYEQREYWDSEQQNPLT